MLQLIEKLDAIELGLPAHLRFNDLNIYIHRDQHQLGAFFALHLVYHQCYCDLYRVVLPGYHFPISVLFNGAPEGFTQKYQEQCQQHAVIISQVAQQGSELIEDAFADPLCGICIYESTKVQVIYMTCVALGQSEIWDSTAQNIKTNLAVLQVIETYHAKRGFYVSEASLWSSDIFLICASYSHFVDYFKILGSLS